MMSECWDGKCVLILYLVYVKLNLGFMYVRWVVCGLVSLLFECFKIYVVNLKLKWF